MPTALRVLIIEDSPDDALLLTRSLERAGYDVAQQRVDTEEALRAALTRPWDLICSDNTMHLQRNGGNCLGLRSTNHIASTVPMAPKR